MAGKGERLQTRIAKVRDGINKQLAKEYEGLGRYGQALQREGYVGGYLEALSDVCAFLNEHGNVNSRFDDLWRKL